MSHICDSSPHCVKLVHIVLLICTGEAISAATCIETKATSTSTLMPTANASLSTYTDPLTNVPVLLIPVYFNFADVKSQALEQEVYQGIHHTSRNR